MSLFLSKNETRYIKYVCKKTWNPIKKINSFIANYNWNWFFISKTVLEMDIEKNLHIPWNWTGVSLNPNISIRFIKKFKDKLNLNLVCKKRTLQEIEKYPELFLDFQELSDNINITIDFIEKYISEDWNWYRLSKNENIKPEDIEKRIFLPWNWKGISRNINITNDFLKKYKYKFSFENIYYIKNTVFFKIKNKDPARLENNLKRDIVKTRRKVLSKIYIGDLNYVLFNYIGFE